MDQIIQQYIDEWKRRNPEDPFANLVKAKVDTVAGNQHLDLYLPIYIGGLLWQEPLMEKSTKGQSFISVENTLKKFFDKYPNFSAFDIKIRNVDPLATTGYLAPQNTTPITFEQVLRSADEKGFHLPKGYILVNELPNTLPDAQPASTITKPTSNKIGIGWILLGIAVGGIVIYNIAKK